MHLEKGAHKYGPTITSRKKRTQITWVRSAFTASCLLPVSNESHFHCTSKLLSPSMWTFSNHSLSTPVSQNKLHLQWPLNLLMLSQNRHAISSKKLHSQDRALTTSHQRKDDTRGCFDNTIRVFHEPPSLFDATFRTRRTCRGSLQRSRIYKRATLTALLLRTRERQHARTFGNITRTCQQPQL